MKCKNRATKSTANLLGIVAAAGLTIGLVGCGQKVEDQASTERKDQPENTVEKSVDSVTKTITSSGKRGAGVKVTFKLPAHINPGETVDVELTYTAPKGEGELSIEVRPDGVELTTEETKKTFSLASEGTHEMPVSIYCPQAGRFYLNIFITRRSAQGTESHQTYSVPVQVGAVVAKQANDDVETDEEGTPVQSMPAKETISEEDDQE